MNVGNLLVEWRHNRRIRVGAMLVIAIVGSHLFLDMRDKTAATLAQAAEEVSTQQRLRVASAERAWPVRARAAEAQRAALLKSIPKADTEGAAQAHLQAWLASVAEQAVVVEPITRIDSTVDVEDFPDLSQVVARLEGTVTTAADLEPVARSLSEGQPWIQVDEFVVSEGEPARVRVIVRSLYRLPYDTATPARGGGV